MWSASDRSDDGGLTTGSKAQQRRVDAAAQYAHERAVELERLRRSVHAATLLGHQTVGDVLAALADAEARAGSFERELERLRSLPELKLGQRVRQPFGVLARRRGGGVTPEDVTPEDAGEAAPARGVTGTSAAVVLVRNRRRAIEPTLDWLARLGVDDVAIIDNATSDPLTLNALEDLGVVVHRSEEDLGDAAPWSLGAMARPLLTADVLMVGEDTVPSATAPPDLIDRMRAELRNVPDAGAVDLVAPVPGDRLAWMRLVRCGAGPSDPTMRIEQPWVELASGAIDPDDPQERYARLHEVDRPRRGPAASG